MSSTEIAANMREFLMVGDSMLTVLGFVGAGLLGFWFGRQQGDAGRVRDLEKELDNQQRKINNYRSQVNRHFEKTATLFTGMAHSYRELYDHLVDSYDRLGDGPSNRFLPRRASALLELSKEEQRRAIPAAAKPAQAAAPAAKAPAAAKPEAPKAAPAAPKAAPAPAAAPKAAAPAPAPKAAPAPQKPAAAAAPQPKPQSRPDPRGATALKRDIKPKAAESAKTMPGATSVKAPGQPDRIRLAAKDLEAAKK